jgi:F0F1-type ATP synthase membrane subunit b/b'
MSRAPFGCPFLRNPSVFLLFILAVTSAIMAIVLLFEFEFISCGPLTRGLRSYIPSYDAHIVASKKRSEIKGKFEKMEADSNAQVKKMKAELKMEIKEAEAELKQKVKEMKAEAEKRVKERRERLLAEGRVSEEPMLFPWIEFFQGMGKMIKEMGVYAIFFCLGLQHFLQLCKEKFPKEEQVLEVQTAEKETQVSRIIEVVNREAEEDKEWSML